MRNSAIITAGGMGNRMGRNVLPKQFWMLGDMTVLEYSVSAFESSHLIEEIIVSVPEKYVKLAKDILLVGGKYNKIKKIVIGGNTRGESVYNALLAVSDTDNVVIHDAARPFISVGFINKMLRMMGMKKALISAKPVVPTLKNVSGSKINFTVSRKGLWEAETPQVFNKNLLLKAFESINGYDFTDEASLCEKLGIDVYVLHNKDINFKITDMKDYILAKNITEGNMIRVGIGYDIHRLVKGNDLIIGGIKIPFDRGCLGHSDGDPLIHAIVDAMLGALSLGDIGEHFPTKSKRYKNIESKVILEKTMAKVRREGYEIINIDTIIIVERPNLAEYKGKMKENIASILGIDLDKVSVKAKTREGLDSEGSGFSISAQAVVTLKKTGDK